MHRILKPWIASVAGTALWACSLLQCSAGMTVREALGQIESGNNDRARGKAGEISRYQILPSVWRRHSSLRTYRDSGHAWAVARMVLSERLEAFRAKTGREARGGEIYALWNAPGKFARRGYRLDRMPPRIRETAQRFENLIFEISGDAK